jgi:malic enzyme
VGVDPGCFDKNVVEAMVRVNKSVRPAIFALSNPKTKAEITARDAYTWSNGAVIYGSGTAFDPVEVAKKTRSPGQVNNVYIFPGVSFGVICCQASNIPERFFMVAAEAVANSLDEADLKSDRVVPHPDRIREVGLNVATAVVMEAQKLGLASRRFPSRRWEVRDALMKMMWAPIPAPPKKSSASGSRRPAVSTAAAAVSQK